MNTNLVTLDHLEFFCRTNLLLVGGRTELGDQYWVSPAGPHSSALSYEQIKDALSGAANFEIREMYQESDEPEVSYYMTRIEMERALHGVLN